MLTLPKGDFDEGRFSINWARILATVSFGFGTGCVLFGDYLRAGLIVRLGGEETRGFAIVGERLLLVGVVDSREVLTFRARSRNALTRDEVDDIYNLIMNFSKICNCRFFSTYRSFSKLLDMILDAYITENKSAYIQSCRIHYFLQTYPAFTNWNL